MEQSSRRAARSRPLTTLLYIYTQVESCFTTIALLLRHFLLPELTTHWNGKMRKAASFNPATDIRSLDGQVILVTGGNAGLGKQTIAYLAARAPTRIYLAARSAPKAHAAIADIRASLSSHTPCEIVHLPLDLTSFSSIAGAASTFRAREPRLDILLLNAGVMATPPGPLTKEGYELQFGTNHIGHALLTKLLLPPLLAAPDARVVTVSSMGHMLARPGGLVFDQSALARLNSWRRYGQSKLANILFTRELAARYPQITAVSVHPGVIITDLYYSMRQNVLLRVGLWLYALLIPFLPGHYKDTKGGALCQTWAATVDKEKLVNGEFYMPVGVGGGGSRSSKDMGLAKKLWDWTEGEFAKHGY